MEILQFRFAIVVNAVCSFVITGASPHHDEIQELSPMTYVAQSYTSGGFEFANGETCQQIHTKKFETIRIGYELLTKSGVSAPVRKHIQNDIMASAVHYFQNILKVRRVSSPLKADQGECGSDKVKIPVQKYITTGVADVDFFVFVTIAATVGCGGNTLAYASHCIRDQCDRPIFAHINFCPAQTSLDADKRDGQVATAIHELTHALVFSSSLFKYFRNPDGSPKLERDGGRPKNIKGQTWWTCSGTQATTWGNDGNRVYVDLSKDGIIGKFPERNMDKCPCPIGQDGPPGEGCLMDTSSFMEPRCVVKVLTPKVQNRTREFFNCKNIEGPELENQPTSECSIIGSHWEQRLFMGELMASTHAISFPSFMSEVTLALFEDSGWYLPDYGLADQLVKKVHWGYKLGCHFARQKCLDNGLTSFPWLWCESKGAYHCDPGRTHVRKCAVEKMLTALPKTVQYYPLDDTNQWLGSLPQADYCPYYGVTIGNRNCKDKLSTWAIVKNVNFMREIFSESSRCLESTLHAEKIMAEGSKHYTAPEDQFYSDVATCYAIECGADRTSYVVRIVNLDDEVIDLGTCNKLGQHLTYTGLKGRVICAAPMEICGVEPPVFLGGAGKSSRKIPLRPGQTPGDTTTTPTGGGGPPGPPGSGGPPGDPGNPGGSGNKADDPPWLMIGCVIGAVVLMSICAGFMCLRGGRAATPSKESQSARDVKLGTEGVQLQPLSQQPNNQSKGKGKGKEPMAYNQAENHGQPLQSNRDRAATEPQGQRFPQSVPHWGVQLPASQPAVQPNHPPQSLPHWGVQLPATQPSVHLHQHHHQHHYNQPQFGDQQPSQQQFGVQPAQQQFGFHPLQQQQPSQQQWGAQPWQQQSADNAWQQFGGPRSHPFRER